MTRARITPLSVVRQVEALALAGVGVTDIARRTGRPREWVQRLINAIGISVCGTPLPHRAAKDLWGTMPAAQIAERLGVGRSQVVYLAGLLGLGPDYRDDDVERLSDTRRPYIRDELAWAVRHRHEDPQAALIAAMVGNLRSRVFANPGVAAGGHRSPSQGEVGQKAPQGAENEGWGVSGARIGSAGVSV